MPASFLLWHVGQFGVIIPPCIASAMWRRSVWKKYAGEKLSKPSIEPSPIEMLLPKRFRGAHERHVHSFASGRTVARRMVLTLKLSRRMKNTYPRAIKLVETGQVDVRSLVTETFALEETSEAFASAARREGLAVERLAVVLHRADRRLEKH